MKAALQKARRELLIRAQDALDGKLGPALVADHVGQELTPVMLARLALDATTRLRAEDSTFAELRVEAVRHEKTRVRLVARAKNR